MVFLAKQKDETCFRNDAAKTGRDAQLEPATDTNPGKSNPDSKKQLRDALAKAIPHVACQRRGSNKILLAKSLQKYDTWPMQQKQDMGRVMLRRAEDELRNYMLHAPTNMIADMLAEHFPKLYQEMLRQRITWTRTGSPKSTWKTWIRTLPESGPLYRRACKLHVTGCCYP